MNSALPLTKDGLIARVEAGDVFEYFFFWGHTPPDDGSINRSCLSQWFAASFQIDGIRYNTAEHWMMAEKARLFGDEEMLKRILVAPDPKTAKALGRNVRDFDRDRWSEQSVAIVVAGNVAKFSQNADLTEFLLSTGEMILVEAAPRDTIWGIGLGARNEKARDPRTWRGRNLLGFALTNVRQRIA